MQNSFLYMVVKQKKEQHSDVICTITPVHLI